MFYKLIIYCTVLLLYAASVFGQQSQSSVAVLDFYTNDPQLSAILLRNSTDKLRNSLRDDNSFHVIERNEIDQTLKEQGIDKISLDSLYPIGRIVNADYVIAGEASRKNKIILNCVIYDMQKDTQIKIPIESDNLNGLMTSGIITKIINEIKKLR